MDGISMGIQMSTKNKLLLGFLMVVLVIVIAISTHWRFKEIYHRFMHDRKHPFKSINSKAEVDAILKDFKTIKYQDLDEEYISYTKSKESKYKPLLHQKSFFVIGRRDFYKPIVGNFRVVDFLMKDKYYKKALGYSSSDYFWLMDKKLLYKTLELIQELENQGYNGHAFGITNGHRHPRHNEKVGGASQSRHIKGEAIDIRIYDIDGNGRYEKADKDIVLKILEEKVIKEGGGIGRYPGTRAVHYDVRGYKARWDSY